MALSNITKNVVGMCRLRLSEEEVQQYRTTISTAATHEIIAAVTDVRIAILKLFVFGNGTVFVTLKTGTDTLHVIRLNLTSHPIENFISNDGIPVFITESGEALNITLGHAVDTYVYVQYVEVT